MKDDTNTVKILFDESEEKSDTLWGRFQKVTRIKVLVFTGFFLRRKYKFI